MATEPDLRTMDGKNRITLPPHIAEKYDDSQRFQVTLEDGRIVAQPVRVEPVNDVQ